IAKSRSLIDLDINDQSDEIDYIKKNNLSVSLICSFHDYIKTPDCQALRDIYIRMQTHNPYIYKYSCYCNEENNAIRLLNLLLEIKSDNKKFIVLGMGEKAIITRIFGSLWGNQMIFAPVKLEKSSAVGQLTIQQFRN